MLVLAVKAVTMPGASDGLAFLFTPDFSQLGDVRIWLEALTQNAWDTGAGWGLILSYAVYMRAREDTALNAFVIGFGNNSMSLLAGIMVMCTIFSVMPQAATEIVGAGNEGLTFIWVPQLFAEIPGGQFFMALFFLALVFAAWSSLVAMIELASRILIDLGLTRRQAIAGVGSAGFLLGIPSALQIGVFQNQDWVWGVGLMLSGFFFAFAVLRYGVTKWRETFINTPDSDVRIGGWWDWAVRLVMVEAVVLMAWFLWQAGGEDFWSVETWTLFSSYNVGSVLIQWAVVLLVLFALNGWMVRRIQAARGGGGRGESRRRRWRVAGRTLPRGHPRRLRPAHAVRTPVPGAGVPGPALSSAIRDEARRSAGTDPANPAAFVMLGAVQGILADLREEDTDPEASHDHGGGPLLRLPDVAGRRRGRARATKNVARSVGLSVRTRRTNAASHCGKKQLGGKAGYLQLPPASRVDRRDAQHCARIRRRPLLARRPSRRTPPGPRGGDSERPARLPSSSPYRRSRSAPCPAGPRALPARAAATSRPRCPAPTSTNCWGSAPRPRSSSWRRCCSAGWRGKIPPTPRRLPTPAPSPYADEPGTGDAPTASAGAPSPASHRPAPRPPPPRPRPPPPLPWTIL